MTTGKPLYNIWLSIYLVSHGQTFFLLYLDGEKRSGHARLVAIYLCSQLQRSAVQCEFAFGSVTDDTLLSPRLTETAPLFTSTRYDILDWKKAGS